MVGTSDGFGEIIYTSHLYLVLLSDRYYYLLLEMFSLIIPKYELLSTQWKNIIHISMFKMNFIIHLFKKNCLEIFKVYE